MGGVPRPIVFSLANFGFNAERRKLPLRCSVLFWLFFVLVLVLVLVRSIDRSCNCIITSWSTRCSGGNLVMDWLMEIRSMIRELGNGGLWAVTEIVLMPSTRSVRSRARAPSATAD